MNRHVHVHPKNLWALCLLAAVVPLLLMFCLCGGAAGAGNFKTIPYDTKQQLISYHTEGQGEDKVLEWQAYVPLASG